jgi:hypothetical protein
LIGGELLTQTKLLPIQKLSIIFLIKSFTVTYVTLGADVHDII